MGHLKNFNDECLNLTSLIKEFNSSVYIETGCFNGDSLLYALTLGFDKIYSCDIDPIQVDIAYKRTLLNIDNNNSEVFLSNLLPKLTEVKSIVFFLDAHMPGFDKNQGIKKNYRYNFPLEREIDIINKYREHKQDIIICDDLRLYEKNNYELNNTVLREKFKLNLDFLKKYNYKVTKYYSLTGYLVLTNIAV